MAVLVSSLKSSLDNISRFEQGRYWGDPEDLAKEIKLRVKQTRGTLAEMVVYANLCPEIGMGIILLEQAAVLNQALLAQKKAPSTFERLVNRVFGFAKYLFWTIPSNTYHWVASSLTGRKWHQADPIDQSPIREVSLTSVYKRLFSYEEKKDYFKVFSL